MEARLGTKEDVALLTSKVAAVDISSCVSPVNDSTKFPTKGEPNLYGR
jgi:hypothetical protein